jgi:pimeloyl-ACP methyl ester carboxylesterase
VNTRSRTRGTGAHAHARFGATVAAPPLLVLLPGLQGTCALMQDFMAALGNDWPTLAIDYPRDRALDHAALADFVRPKLPAQRPFVLLGESFSGPVAIRLAADKPRMLRGLVLSTSFAANPRPALAGLARFARAVPPAAMPLPVFEFWLLGRWASPRLREQFRAVLADVDGGVLAERLVACLQVDERERLARVEVPTLYLRARQDRLVTGRSAQQVADANPRVRVRELDGPHCLLQAVPEAAALAVKEFLGGVVGIKPPL